MDWGLFDKNAGENTFLREEIVYSSTVRKPLFLLLSLFETRTILHFIFEQTLLCEFKKQQYVHEIVRKRQTKSFIKKEQKTLAESIKKKLMEIKYVKLKKEKSQSN